MIEVVAHAGAAAFLSRAEEWLLMDEAQYNLHLSLAYARSEGAAEPDALFATVELDGSVVGCVIRTPPHKLLVTEMPLDSTAAVAAAAADRYAQIPCVLGPAETAEAIAAGWVSLRGGSYRRGMPQRMYRLDEVAPIHGVPGAARPATEEDLELLKRWGGGFGDDVGAAFVLEEKSIVRMIRQDQMFIWEDGGPAAMTVAQGVTPSGCRVGYVYTPPNRRGRGYASALVADVSQRMLDSGLAFCVLYTDLANPTSNSIYQKIGYQPIADVMDVDLVPAETQI